MKTLKYPDKVEMLRKAVCVSGKLLLHGKPTDSKIDNQINILMNTIDRDDDECEKEYSRIYSKLDVNMSEEEAKAFITGEFYKFIGFDKFGPLDTNFWRNFGSAPYYQKYEDEKKKPGIGMDTIFNGKFHNESTACGIIHDIDNMFEQFKEKKKNAHEKIARKNIVSPYKNLDDLEDNVSVKKITAEAEIFYKDETKDFKERLKVFNKHGFEDGCIHEPSNPNLRKIFEIYHEQGHNQRHETVSCDSVVNWWISMLERNRTKISYAKNKYHPDLKGTKRKYTPSKASVDRLRRYYLDIVLSEGVAGFELDW